MEDQYPWLRRETETSQAYEAFRVYLNLRDGKRTASRVSEIIGKGPVVKRWMQEHDWVERVRAYENHLALAATDGYTDQLASVKEKHITLADKLLTHLDSRLDDFITKKLDPTVRWTQAFTAAIKAHQGAFLMKDTSRQDEMLTTAMDLLNRLEDAEKTRGE